MLLEGRITRNYLLTGLVASVAAASLVSGLIIHFLHVLNNIQQDNQQLNNIINACPVPMALNDSKHTILSLNPEFTKCFGYHYEDIPTIEQWWQKAYPDREYRRWVIAAWQSRLDNMIQTGKGFEPLEVKIHCKDGEQKIVLATTTPLASTHDVVYLVVLYDISDQAHAAESLLASHNVLQSIIEAIPIRVFWKDLESRYLGCNTAFAKDGGQSTPAEIIGKVDQELTWRDQAQLYRQDDQTVMQSGTAKLAFQEPQTTPNGDTIWLRTSKIPLKDKNCRTIGVLGVYEDITFRKKIEDELWLTKTILDKSSTAFFRLSPTGKVLYVNDYACRSLGYSREELLTCYPWDFDPDFSCEDWPVVWETLKREKSINIETRHQRKDGSQFNVNITGHYICYNGDEFSFTFAQDVTERKRIETALRKKEGYQRALLDNFPFEVWLKDTESRFLAVNQMFAKTFGADDPDALIGKTDFDIASENLATAYRLDDKTVMDSKQRKIVEEEIEQPRGRKWVETYKAPVIDDTGKLWGTVGFARDISERKQIETELRIAATAFESQEGIVITDADTVILKTNRSFTDITGFRSEEVVGQKMNFLKSGIHDHAFYRDMWSTIFETGYWQGEIWNRRKDGQIYPEWLTITAVKNDKDQITHYVGTMLDITARKAIEDEVRHMAHYDVLTNLPNRSLLTDRLHQAVAQVRREKGKLALLFLDLDNFKPINDNLGHAAGDLLLQQVAHRLVSCMRRESDTVARLGGDEFVILLVHIDDVREAETLARKVVQIISRPFELDTHIINISTSIGIAMYPDDGVDSSSLLKLADMAMYQAKEDGRGCFRLYQPAAGNQRKNEPSVTAMAADWAESDNLDS